MLAVAALVDPERGALLDAEDLADTNRRTARAYEALLPRLPEILEHPERFARHYAEEQAALVASRQLIDGGVVAIEEHRELDLAVVTLSRPVDWSHRLGHRSAVPLHPIALHSASPCSRMLIIDGARRAYHDRYESWVAYCSRRLPLRRDLTPLASRLNELERNGGSWRGDSPGALVAALDHEGESDLAPDVLIELLTSHLRTAPPAWDPFAPPPRG